MYIVALVTIATIDVSSVNFCADGEIFEYDITFNANTAMSSIGGNASGNMSSVDNTNPVFSGSTNLANKLIAAAIKTYILKLTTCTSFIKVLRFEFDLFAR